MGRAKERTFQKHEGSLSFLVRHLFNNRIDVVCKPNLSDDDCDAVIVDYRKRPLRVRSIVFARAILSYEAYLRRLYLPDEEHAFTFSRLTQRDRRDHKRKSADDGETLLHVILLNKGLELIAKAARANANRPYGKLATLAIVFDDYGTFRSQEDLSLLEDFVITEVLPMNLDFGKLLSSFLSWTTVSYERPGASSSLLTSLSFKIGCSFTVPHRVSRIEQSIPAPMHISCCSDALIYC
jgi:hypothetical protein